MVELETLEVEKDEDILYVFLNRRHKANAINIKMIKELISLADWLNENPEVRFVVFSNKGSIFSSGYDLYELCSFLEKDQMMSNVMQKLGHELMRKLEQLDQITIAAMRGSAYGGGFAIAMTTDYRIMIENSIINLPETNLGMFLTWGCTPRLVKEIGANKAKEMIMLCEDYSASECYRLGIINKVTTPESLDKEVVKYIDRIRKSGLLSIKLTKKLISAANAVNIGDILINEPELVDRVTSSGETKSKVIKFIRKDAH